MSPEESRPFQRRTDYTRPQPAITPRRPINASQNDQVMAESVAAAEAMIGQRVVFNQPAQPVSQTPPQPGFRIQSYTDVEQPTAQPVIAVEPAPTEAQPVPQAPAKQVLSFEPPKKEKQPDILTKVITKRPNVKLPALPTKAVVAASALFIVLSSGYGIAQWHAAVNDPGRIFSEALHANLTAKKVAITTTVNNSSDQALLDLSDSRQPVANTTATVSLAGALYKIKAYGTTKDTYFSYSNLPAKMPAATSGLLKDGWVKLRDNGVQPQGVPAAILNQADPRYQAYGAMVFANLTGTDEKSRQQIVSYLNDHQIYKFDKQAVSKTKIGDKKMWVYPVTVNAGYLKVFNQSVAVSSGVDLSSVQSGLDELDRLGQSKVKLYIDAKTHTVAGLNIEHNGQVKQISYNMAPTDAVPAEPQTNLAWQNFANAQFIMESQLGKLLPTDQQDALRMSQLDGLHKALANYFTVNGYYPNFNELNNQTWLAKNMPALDVSLLRDPLATNLTIYAAPRAGVLAYQPVGDSAAGLCNNASANSCSSYTLTATLSNGQLHSVKNP